MTLDGLQIGTRLLRGPNFRSLKWQKIKARDCEPLFASSNSEEPVPSKNRILAVAEVRTA